MAGISTGDRGVGEMRRRRADENQAEIVGDLRAIGAYVLHLHTIGGGCPDIVVLWRGVRWMFDIKGSQGRLFQKQRDWHRIWREAGGNVAVIRTSEEAFRIMGMDVADAS